MTARLLLAFVLAGLFAAPAAFAQAGGKKYAVLVGIKAYDHSDLPDLQHTENDVEELARVLREQGKFDQVIVLTTSRGKDSDALKPTAKNIREQLKKITDKVTKRDLLLVGLAGHGLQIAVVDSTTKKERDESFFCASDARPRSNRSLVELKKTMIPLGEFFKELEASGAGTKLLLVDACRNEVKKDSSSRSGHTDLLPKPSRGVGALFSCKGGERAFETTKLGKGHGVFFHFVIEAMKGKAKNDKGEVTWSRLVDYVVENVSDQVPILIGDGARQTPQELKNLEGKAPILIPRILLDPSEAVKWFDLGLKYEYGNGVAKDDPEAVKWFRKAADNGHARAMYALAWRYAEGRTVAKDDQEALKWYRKSADKGDDYAQNQMGWRYRTGLGVKQSHADALRWFRLSADKGNALGMVNLGVMYENGYGIERDYREARKWYQKGADKGEAEGMLGLGWLYQNGHGVERDLGEARKWYLQSAAKGNVQSMVNLGWMYDQGLGVTKDHKEAIRWYLPAAEKNHLACIYSLASLYRESSTEKNEKEALKWYGEGARKGHVNSMTWYGVYHEMGTVTDKNIQEAVKWYRLAADKGEVQSEMNLATCYLYGNGVVKNETEALRRYRKAAALNEPRAEFFVGYIYEHGLGVQKDVAEALRWYRKSAARNYDFGIKAVERLTK